MVFVRHLLWVFVSIVPVLLVSCIDGREEIWLNANGSGRVDVSYTIPAMAASLQGGEIGIRRLISEFLESSQEISSSKVEISTRENRLNVRVQATFDSALELKELSQSMSGRQLPSAAQFMAGEFEVKTRGLSVNFARTISPGKALPGAAFIPKSQTKDRSLTYIIHLPKAATDSNATRIEDGGRTLIWEYPLAQAIQKPVTTRFVAPIPIPAWLPATILTTAFVVVFFIFRQRRKSRNPPTIQPVA